MPLASNGQDIDMLISVQRETQPTQRVTEAEAART